MHKKKYIVLVIILVVIAGDLIIANLPSPVPTSQAISNVEQSYAFKSIISSSNATYSYTGYSSDPQHSTQCVYSLFGDLLHFFSPFHEYTTTSLIFLVDPFVPYQKSGTILNATLMPFVLFVQINPSTGRRNR